MHHNAGSAALKENNLIVIYFATGRGPIGSEAGKLYAFRDAFIVKNGEKFFRNSKTYAL